MYKFIDLIMTFSVGSAVEKTTNKNVQFGKKRFVSKFSEEDKASATAKEMWNTKRGQGTGAWESSPPARGAKLCKSKLISKDWA